MIVAAVLPPTQYSRRDGCSAAYTIACAATSGWKIGGTGWGWRRSRESTQSNCGVFTAGSCTMVIFTSLPALSSSVRTDSVKPFMACFAPQYAAWSGMPR